MSLVANNFEELFKEKHHGTEPTSIIRQSNSPQQTRAKHQPDNNLQQLEATSIDAATTDGLIRAERLLNQQSTNLDDPANQQL